MGAGRFFYQTAKWHSKEGKLISTSTADLLARSFESSLLQQHYQTFLLAQQKLSYGHFNVALISKT